MDDCKSIQSNGISDKMKHSVAQSLDVCLDRIFNYMLVECYDAETGMLNWERSKSLYQTFLDVFDKVILPTYNIHHVQFVMFLLCSFKPAITEAFINYLCKKVYAPNMASVIRQTAVAYIASLLSRGAFISMR